MIRDQMLYKGVLITNAKKINDNIPREVWKSIQYMLNLFSPEFSSA